MKRNTEAKPIRRDDDRKYRQRMIAAQAVAKAMGMVGAAIAIERDVITMDGVVGGIVTKVRVFPFAIDTTRGRFGGMQGIDKKNVDEIIRQGNVTVAWADHVVEQCVWARLQVLLAPGETHDDRGRPVVVPIDGSKGGGAPGATPQLLWPEHYIKEKGGSGPMSPELSEELRSLWKPVSKAGKKRVGKHHEERHNYRQSEAAARDWKKQSPLF